jgi:cytochrome P450
MRCVPVAAAAARLFDPDVCGDPYPLYRELFADGPVVPSPHGWLVGGYDAVTAVLRDNRFGHAAPEPPADETREQRIDRRLFIKQNPPEHTYLRGLVSKAFTPKTVAGLRPSIEAMVDGLLDAMPRHEPVDLIGSFAAPLPVAVISEMLGVPEADRPAFRQWSEDMVLPEGAAGEDPAAQARWRNGCRQFADYLTALVDERRKHPGDDLVSRLVAVADEDPRFTLDDLLATGQLLLFAGHETTVNLLANGVLALLCHTAQLDRLRADPDGLIASAVEELLRYDGPVHLTARTALEDVDLAGRPIARGEVVIVLLGAANRDPSRYPDPDTLDLTRERNQHVGFGVGIHFCLGAPLARLEAQIALPALLRHAPKLQLAADPADLTWRHSLMLRGLDRLPVVLGDR